MDETTRLASAPKTVALIESEVLRRIQEDKLGTGAMLPGYNELARQIGAAPATVQRAVAKLVARGVLRSEKRRGTFVVDGALGPPTTEAGRHRRPVHAGETAARAFVAERRPPATLADPREPLLLSLESSQFEGANLPRPARFIILASLNPYRELPTSHEIWSRRASSSFERYVQALGHSTHSINLMDRPSALAADDIDAAVAEGADVIAYMEDGSQTAASEALLHKRLAATLLRGGSNAPILVRVRWGSSVGMSVDTATFDGALGVYLATKYLIELGHRNIVYAAPCRSTVRGDTCWTQRIAALYRALYESGEEWAGPDRDRNDPDAWHKVVYADTVPDGQDMWFDTGRSAWRRILERGPIPDAIVAANDQAAYAIIEQARAAGYDIPGQISVVGYDDRECGAAINLTTVHVPVEELGVAAAKMSLFRLAHPTTQARTELVLLPTLVVRGTTRQRNYD